MILYVIRLEYVWNIRYWIRAYSCGTYIMEYLHIRMKYTLRNTYLYVWNIRYGIRAWNTVWNTSLYVTNIRYQLNILRIEYNQPPTKHHVYFIQYFWLISSKKLYHFTYASCHKYIIYIYWTENKHKPNIPLSVRVLNREERGCRPVNSLKQVLSRV